MLNKLTLVARFRANLILHASSLMLILNLHTLQELTIKLSEGADDLEERLLKVMFLFEGSNRNPLYSQFSSLYFWSWTTKSKELNVLLPENKVNVLGAKLGKEEKRKMETGNW